MLLLEDSPIKFMSVSRTSQANIPTVVLPAISIIGEKISKKTTPKRKWYYN